MHVMLQSLKEISTFIRRRSNDQELFNIAYKLLESETTQLLLLQVERSRASEAEL